MLCFVSFARPSGLALAMSMGLAVMLSAPEARAAGPKYEAEDGTVDPRKRELPRRHRFRLALEGSHIRLTSAQSSTDGSFTRFHWAPLMLDASYQLQFAKVLMLRPGFAAGLNVANSRYAMPAVFSPRFFTGYQGRHAGIAAGYVYYATGYPGLTVENGADGRDDSIGGPRIWNAHGVLGELSFTSRIDGIAISFAAQTSLSNLIAGLFLLVDRPFQVGDTSLCVGSELVRSVQLFPGEHHVATTNGPTCHTSIHSVKFQPTRPA